MLKKVFAAACALAAALVLWAGAAWAEAQGVVDVSAGLAAADKSALAQKVISIATGVGALAGAVGVIMMIYCGYKMMTSTRENERAEAKGQFISVLIGMAIIGTAVLVVSFLANLIGS